MHPASRIEGNRGSELKGTRVILIVSGSIAAVETVKLAREMIRHGAEVIPVMTEAALGIISPEALKFASGKEPVLRLSGMVEHITLFADGMKNVVVVAPATADIISKVANGLADDAASTICLNALGLGVPMIFAPSMGASMLGNPFLGANSERLRRQGVELLPSLMAEEEAKLLDISYLVASVSRSVSEGILKRRNVLVVGGAGEEPLDDVRFISSRSTGITAVELASVAFEQKAAVSMWCGRMEVSAPPFAKTRGFRTVGDLMRLAEGRKFDIVAVPAALPDFAPKKKEGKISSTHDTEIQLKVLPKFLEHMRDRSRFLIGFKAESGDEKRVVENARRRLAELHLDMIVANNVQNVQRLTTRAHILLSSGKHVEVVGSKRELAERIFAEVAQMLHRSV